MTSATRRGWNASPRGEGDLARQQPAHGAALGEDRRDPRAARDVNAGLQQPRALLQRQRHLRELLEGEQLDVGRARGRGGLGAVGRHRAAADHRHAPAGDAPVAARGEERGPRLRQLLAGDAETQRLRQPGRHHHRGVALAEQRGGSRHLALPHADLAERGHEREVGGQHLGLQAERRDQPGHAARGAQPRGCPRDTGLREHRRRPGPRRPAADDRHPRPARPAAVNSGITPRARALAMIVACTAGISTGVSNVARAHAAMQWVSGHTAPHTPPSGFAAMIIPAARRKSDGAPTRTAMMKSAGEQSAGHAPLHGFASQYSHLAISVASWASVKVKGLLGVMDPPGETSLAQGQQRGAPR